MFSFRGLFDDNGEESEEALPGLVRAHEEKLKW